jgi:hypothetical protein
VFFNCVWEIVILYAFLCHFAPTFSHKFWMNFCSTFVYGTLNSAFICHEYFRDYCVNSFVLIILSFRLQIIYFIREKQSAFDKKIRFEVMNYFVHMKFKFGSRSAWRECKYINFIVAQIKWNITSIAWLHFWVIFINLIFLGHELFSPLIFK